MQKSTGNCTETHTKLCKKCNVLRFGDKTQRRAANAFVAPSTSNRKIRCICASLVNDFTVCATLSVTASTTSSVK